MSGVEECERNCFLFASTRGMCLGSWYPKRRGLELQVQRLELHIFPPEMSRTVDCCAYPSFSPLPPTTPMLKRA